MPFATDPHPVFVHFALALPLMASALYPLSRGVPSARPAAHWCLGVGVCFLWLAVGSGMWAAIRAGAEGEARAAIALHQYWGWATAVLYSLAVALIASLRRVGWPVLTVLALAAVAAVGAGYLGGENVYRHGIGVAPEALRPTPG